MQVILLERVDKLGLMGDVVTVKPGFARNYLLPKGKALRATEQNLKHFETQKIQLETQNLERKSDAEAISNKMAGKSVILVRQAGEAGQLYGSVNARDIARALTDEGFTVERNQVHLEEPIKALGFYKVSVALHPEISVSVNANVARSEEEAKIQSETGRAVLSQAEEEARAQVEAVKATAESAADDAVVEQADVMFEKGAAPNITTEEEALENSPTDSSGENLSISNTEEP